MTQVNVSPVPQLPRKRGRPRKYPLPADAELQQESPKTPKAPSTVSPLPPSPNTDSEGRSRRRVKPPSRFEALSHREEEELKKAIRNSGS